jgi:hypothetical protein
MKPKLEELLTNQMPDDIICIKIKKGFSITKAPDSFHSLVLSRSCDVGMFLRLFLTTPKEPESDNCQKHAIASDVHKNKEGFSRS